MKLQKEMKDDTEIVSVHSEYNNPIRFLDEGYGPLWIYCTSTGVTGIVRDMSFEKAYDCVLDEILLPIPEEELYEAYGFDSQEDFKKAADKASENEEYLDLVEGYRYQPNSSGTGIVSTDLNGESLEELTSETWKRLGLKIKIKRCD